MLQAAGYSLDVDLNQPGFVRAIVRNDDHAAKVDWARDSDWRFMPSGEIGCLYYSASRQEFVDPRNATDAVPHFGRPGGVLPRIAD